ncbi:MAG: methyltransferase domain-containing protein [Xanthobacteraceae bacterium]
MQSLKTITPVDLAMHKAQTQFCQLVKARFPNYFVGKSVLDVGSYNVNGDNRHLFEKCEYLGIDVAAGPNVDRVIRAHELDYSDASFDVIISTECFEHDMHYRESLQTLSRILKSKGLLLFTCATEGRKSHGTRKKNPQDSPGTVQQGGAWADYYRNLTEADIHAAIDVAEIFVIFEFTVNPVMYDLYFWGIKR